MQDKWAYDGCIAQKFLNYMTLPLSKSHASMMTKRPLYIS